MKNFKFYFIACFAMLISTYVDAQINISTIKINEFNSEVLNKHSSRLFDKTNFNKNLVGTFDFSKIETEPFVVNMKYDRCLSFTFDLQSFERIGNDDFTFYSELQNENQCLNTGSLLIAKIGNKISGTLVLDHQYFDITALDDKYIAISEYNQTQTGERSLYDDCETVEGIPSEISVPDGVEYENDDVSSDATYCPIKVLVMYTANAVLSNPNLESVITAAQYQTNTILGNSNVLRANIVALNLGELDFTETGSISNDVSSLKNNTTVNTLMSLYGADLAILLTEGNYGSFGVVSAIGPGLNARHGIVQISAAIGNRLTFAHEVGHLFGCRHIESQDSTPGFAHGHITSNGHPTCLAPLGNTGSRIMHYSNPNILFSNLPTGIANLRDNARMWRSSACIVSGFESDATFVNPYNRNPISVSAPPRVCPCDTIKIRAYNNDSSQTYNYAWSISANATNYVNIPPSSSWLSGNSTILTIVVPCNAKAGFFVKLKATSASGKVYTIIKYIRIWNTNLANSPCEKKDNPKDAANEIEQRNKIEEVEMNITPNPASNSVDISYRSNSEELISIRIIDTNGKEVISQSFIKVSGYFNIVHDISSLASGQYMLSITGSNGTVTNKIFVKL